MDNGRISLSWILAIIFLLAFISSSFYKDTIIEGLNEEMMLLEQDVSRYKDTVQIEQNKIDSVNILLSAKKQTIINNTYIYEQRNKEIANFDSTATDSLYTINLRSAYKRYGVLIPFY